MCIVLPLSPEIFNVCNEFGAIVQSFPGGVLAAVWSSSPELPVKVKARTKCTNTSSSRCHSMSLLSLPRRACFHLPENRHGAAGVGERDFDRAGIWGMLEVGDTVMGGPGILKEQGKVCMKNSHSPIDQVWYRVVELELICAGNGAFIDATLKLRKEFTRYF